MNKKPIYIKLSDGEIDKTTEIDRVDYGVYLDYDKQGFLCGIKILGYKELTIGQKALTLDQYKQSIIEKCAKKMIDLDFDTEYKLEIFRNIQSEHFDGDNKSHSGNIISHNTMNLMLEIINGFDNYHKNLKEE